MVTKKFKGLDLASFHRDWGTCISLSILRGSIMEVECEPLIVDMVKLNFDGSSKGNLGPAGFGCVVLDHKGSIIRVICGPLRDCNSVKMETPALLFGLRELKAMGIRDCCVEGGCNMVIGWGEGIGNGSWQLAQFIYEIRELSSLLGVSCAGP